MTKTILLLGALAAGPVLAAVTILPAGTHVHGCTFVGYTTPRTVAGLTAKKMFARLDKAYTAEAEAAGANVVLITYPTLQWHGGDTINRAPMLRCPEPLVFE